MPAPDVPRGDMRPCLGCKKKLVPQHHLSRRRRERRARVAPVWVHAVPADCSLAEPAELAEWEEAYAVWRETTVAELHAEGWFAAVCTCEGEPACTGFVIVDVHSAALYTQHCLEQQLQVPTGRELW